MPALQNNGAGKRMEYAPVDFNVNEIMPDAPEGEWVVSIPRGKVRVQPTKEDHFPMLIVPIRLDKTEEEGDVFEKALGAELRVNVVFFPDTHRAAKMNKLRLRQLCDAAEIDLDTIPKRITNPEADLADLVGALEGKKFPAWTKHNTRRDTGETIVDVIFSKPGALPGKPADADSEEERPATKGKGGKGRR